MDTRLKNIKVEYILSKREIKKVNEKCNLGFGFDTFKADNHILSILSRANGMIGWMVKKNFLKGGKCHFKDVWNPNKTSYRILHSGLDSNVNA